MKKQSTSQASWSILSEGVSASRVESHIVRSHVNQMIEAIKSNPQVAEHIYRICGDNFEAIPKHLSKLERALDRTNYALITMGSDWSRQRLTHEDREMVDMAAKYNPTPSPSTSKQSEKRMRNASFGDIILDVIGRYEDELMELDPEYIEGGDDYAQRKYEALHEGDINTALLFTRDREVKEVLLTIQSDLDRIEAGELPARRRSASDNLRNLEMRIARLERSAAPRPTPPGVWEEFGDTRREQVVNSIPSPKRTDITPRKYDYNALRMELADALSRGGRGNALYKKMVDGEVKVHLFRLLAEYTEDVPVSGTYPDGGATYVLYEAYYTNPKTGETVKAYLRVESMLIAGGSFVGGKILDFSEANNFLAAAKRDGWDIKDYL